MSDDLTDLYQQVILDHCRKPRNFHELGGADLHGAGPQPACAAISCELFLRLEVA
jgi:nitrogen fixation protein NifU and related proteins